MRGLAIGGGLLGVLLTVGIILYMAFGASTGAPPKAGEGAAPAGGSVGAALEARKAMTADLALAVVRRRIQEYRALNDKYPSSLDEIAKTAPLPALPPGMSYRYDSQTGTVEAQ